MTAPTMISWTYTIKTFMKIDGKPVYDEYTPCESYATRKEATEMASLHADLIGRSEGYGTVVEVQVYME